jgi:mono/diheme cytochrome c family protein
MRRIVTVLVGLAVVGAGAGWLLTAPSRLPDDTFAGLMGDPVHGEQVFWAAGCASCHAPADATGDAEVVLSGGQKFATAFGTFIAPNISPDPEHGIGGWTLAEFGNAVQRGVSPEGQHYYPAFPYASYQNMAAQDVADLKAFMDGLPASTTPSQAHEVGFPFNIRRSVGGWKLLFWPKGWAVDGDLNEAVARGRYVAEAMAHCGECHTPRNALGGLERDRWLAGAANPSGEGRIPNITPAKLTWSEDEIIEYLTSGFTPEYDSAGGHMAHVVENLARLPDSDRAAIAAYLKKVEPAE